jgi:hypothetical protein
MISWRHTSRGTHVGKGNRDRKPSPRFTPHRIAVRVSGASRAELEGLWPGGRAGVRGGSEVIPFCCFGRIGKRHARPRDALVVMLWVVLALAPVLARGQSQPPSQASQAELDFPPNMEIKLLVDYVSERLKLRAPKRTHS